MLAVRYIGFDEAGQVYRVHFAEPDPAMRELEETQQTLMKLKNFLTNIRPGTHSTGRYVGFTLPPHVSADVALLAVKSALCPELPVTALKITLSYAAYRCRAHSTITLRGVFAPGLVPNEGVIPTVVEQITDLGLTTLSQEWSMALEVVQADLSPVFSAAGIFVQELKSSMRYTQTDCPVCK